MQRVKLAAHNQPKPHKREQLPAGLGSGWLTTTTKKARQANTWRGAKAGAVVHGYGAQPPMPTASGRAFRPRKRPRHHVAKH